MLNKEIVERVREKYYSLVSELDERGRRRDGRRSYVTAEVGGRSLKPCAHRASWWAARKWVCWLRALAAAVIGACPKAEGVV